MEEPQRKRIREEEIEEERESKRISPFNHILSLLEADEEEPTDELLTTIVTNLEQELTSEQLSEPILSPSLPPPSPLIFEEEGEEEEETVIRYLLEASDHELGIPPSPLLVREEHQDDEEREDSTRASAEEANSTSTSIYDGFWEFEEESANYYSLLQSELML